jgi:AcrR family transcriptional regulator
VDGRVERGRATREALIAAARELFGAQGYDSTSIDAVLAEAGVARGALYHHFATKTELFDAVLERETMALAVAVGKAARPTREPLAGLRAGCEAFLRLALDPAVQRITMLDAPAVVGWVRWRELDRRYLLGGVETAISHLADDGRVDSAEVEYLSHMILAAVGEAAMFVATSDDPDAALQTALAAVDTLLTRVLRPSPGRSSRSRRSPGA